MGAGIFLGGGRKPPSTPRREAVYRPRGPTSQGGALAVSPQPGTGAIRAQDLPEGRDLERELAVPLDTLTPDGLPTVLRRFLAGSERTLKAHLLTHEPRLYSVTFRLEGEETITTPAGEFDCLRVRMEVDLGFLNLFRVFAPEIRFWFAREWPHFWVRYQGPESGRGSPEIIRIMTHYSRED